MKITLAVLLMSLPLVADELPAEAKQVLDAYVKAMEARNADEMWELYGARQRKKVEQQVQGGDRMPWLLQEAERLMGKGGAVEVKEVILGVTVSIAHVKFPSGRTQSLRFGKEDGTMRLLDAKTQRNTGNEIWAQVMLKQLVSTEGVWRQTDSDRNGAQDYWTRDVAGYYYIQDANGQQLKYIDVNMAKADRLGLETYLKEQPTPKGGYWLRAMVTDENGKPYVDEDLAVPNATPVSDRPSTNTAKFAYCSYPAEYGASGTMTYIVNEEGVVYEKDLGADAKDGCDTWPDPDPTTKGWVASE